MEEKVKFKRKVGDKGNVLGISIPQELISFLDIQSGDELTMIGDTGKHGKYIAIFKEEQ